MGTTTHINSQNAYFYEGLKIIIAHLWAIIIFIVFYEDGKKLSYSYVK
jgi:hypothetical protein